ncbi:TPA: aminotransferase [Citrobacter freundii]
MDNLYTYKSDQDLLTTAQEVAALLSCSAFVSISNDEKKRIHLMSLMDIASRLADDLANALDKSSVLTVEGERK